MNDTFTMLGVAEQWTERLNEKGITMPSPIQQASIPELLRGGDAVIRARTGTGKTLAYLLPLLTKLDASSDKLQAIVLAPTAELAMQILKEAGDLLTGTSLRALACIGGASLQRQLDKLKLHPQLIVGTPGRLVELLHLKKLKTSAVKMIVIDEADQTFALGAGGETDKLLAALPNREQTIFCSATMPEAANAFVKKWASEAVWLEAESAAGGDEEEPRLPETVEHLLVIAEGRDKIDTLRRLIRTVSPKAAILFVNQTESVAEVEAKLQYHGLDVKAIYGDQPKLERTAVMRKFRDGKLKLLLATDVAARGLDAPNVTHVIHVDPPYKPEGYLHRAGRTGRMGRSGTSVLLLPPNKKFIANKLSQELGIVFHERKLQGGTLTDASRDNRRTSTRPEVSELGSTSGSAVPKKPEGAKEKRAATASPAVSTSTTSSRNVPPPANRKPSSDRKRDQKNKGAPRWLKEKRNGNGGSGHDGAPKP